MRTYVHKYIHTYTRTYIHKNTYAHTYMHSYVTFIIIYLFYYALCQNSIVASKRPPLQYLFNKLNFTVHDNCGLAYRPRKVNVPMQGKL